MNKLLTHVYVVVDNIDGELYLTTYASIDAAREYVKHLLEDNEGYTEIGVDYWENCYGNFINIDTQFIGY